MGKEDYGNVLIDIYILTGKEKMLDPFLLYVASPSVEPDPYETSHSMKI